MHAILRTRPTFRTVNTKVKSDPSQRIRSLLVANRGEIAIRVMRAASELGLRTVAIYSQEDRFSLHRTKADEAYLVGRDRGPVEAYLDIEDILRIAREARVDAIHPGYGFLAENPDFARACAASGIIFVGPEPQTMQVLGNKVAARELAVQAGVAVMPASAALPAELDACAAVAAGIGYPVMLKASWGGGGRGMRVVEGEAQLRELLPVARREAQAAFGNDEVYLEKLVRRARHVEVQILGDQHGNLVHLFERDCTAQRRNQKVVERAPAVFLSEAQRAQLCAAALAIGRAAAYRNAGTVEFLQDADSGDFYFIEVNPRIQVEHTVTECATGIDLVKAQIRIAGGARIGEPASGVPAAGRDPHQRACPAVPHHHRGPGKQLHPRLRHDHRVPQPGRLRRAPGRRHRLHRRDHLALLRFAAGEGDRLGADPRGDHRAHAPRAVGVPHPRRGEQPALPRPAHHAPALRQRRLHHALHRGHPGAVPVAAQARPRQPHPLLHRHHHRQRPSGDPQPPAAGELRAREAAAGPAAGAGAGQQAEARRARRRRASRSGCSRSSACSSPTPACAMRTSRCWPRACARST